MTNQQDSNTDDSRDQDGHDRQDGQDGHDRPEHDPRLGEPEGDEGMPASLLDTERNLPGDQPTDQRGPNASELKGTS